MYDHRVHRPNTRANSVAQYVEMRFVDFSNGRCGNPARQVCFRSVWWVRIASLGSTVAGCLPQQRRVMDDVTPGGNRREVEKSFSIHGWGSRCIQRKSEVKKPSALMRAGSSSAPPFCSFKCSPPRRRRPETTPSLPLRVIRCAKTWRTKAHSRIKLRSCSISGEA